jgi:ferredoxin/flavodoxin
VNPEPLNVYKTFLIFSLDICGRFLVCSNKAAKMDFQIFIVYSSPSGSTRKVAKVIEEELRRRSVDVHSLDLSQAAHLTEFLNSIKTAGRQACLFIGSPVYRDAAVPPVVDAIEKLPHLEGAFAVPFVTWGQACSGMALWQMGSALRDKGFKIAGAAKVLAVHSMMWHTGNPAGKGHPDEKDLHVVRELVETLFNRLHSKDIPGLSLDILDYHPPIQSVQMKQKINAPRMIVPKEVDQDLCIQCGICEEECPVEAVVLNPFPKFDRNCFDCFNCIRLCPEDAIKPAISMSQIEARIRERIRTIREQPYTQIFL